MGPALRTLSLALAASLAARPHEPTADEEAARAALAKAERLVQRGSYARALADYRALAERYAGTAAADEASRRATPNGALGSAEIERSGPCDNRLDLAFLAEGFTLRRQKDFARSAADAARLLAQEPVFEEYAAYVNLHRVHLASAEEGLSGSGRTFSTALGARVVSDASSSTHLEVVVPRVERVLADLAAWRGEAHPAELAVVLVEQGGFGSAGEGLVTLGTPDAQNLLAGLGHALAGLAIERAADTGLVLLPGARVPPNVSGQADAVPWRHWIDAEAAGIGVHEGAQGQLRGAWRASSGECWMGDLGARGFCVVCREALVLALYDAVDPIESCSPPAQPAGMLGVEDFALRGEAPLRFAVQVLRPATHRLRIRWWVLSAASFPGSPLPEDRTAPRPRSLRGPLPALNEPALREERPLKGRDELEVDPAELAPGLYRVLCRVDDPTDVRGSKLPWVLRDEQQRLTSERGWWVVVE